MLVRCTLIASQSPPREILLLSTHAKSSFGYSKFLPTRKIPNFLPSFRSNNGLISCCSSPNNTNSNGSSTTTLPPPLPGKRKRYRKPYPGEDKGIVEEMRFVAMKLRKDPSGAEENSGDDDPWVPSLEGFIQFLVDSKLVFDTLDRIVEESDHVAYAYFRKNGLERSEALLKDLEWFREQGFAVPEPGSPGVNYAKYLEEIAEKSAPIFLCHFYNIYFAHIAGGQVIVNQVSEKILEGRELEFSKWDGDVAELLKDTRDKLNKLGEHWSRDEKNKCLREATKSFQFSGQILRLIVI